MACASSRLPPSARWVWAESVSLIESEVEDRKDRNTYRLVPVWYCTGTFKLSDGDWKRGLWSEAWIMLFRRPLIDGFR